MQFQSTKIILNVTLAALAAIAGLGRAEHSPAACDCTSCCCHVVSAIQLRDDGPWKIAESPNFQVCSLSAQTDLERVARRCECLRTKLAATWLPDAKPWTPRCQIVLHAQLAGYRRAVGACAEQSLGSSLVAPPTGTIASRRIDLRTDVDDVLTAALPHELFHVVIADRFRQAPPPLWFDEGAALQYDPAA